MEQKIIDPIAFRFRGLRKDGELIQSNNIDDLPLQDFHWFEEVATMTPEEMWESLKLRSHVLFSPTTKDKGQDIKS